MQLNQSIHNLSIDDIANNEVYVEAGPGHVCVKLETRFNVWFASPDDMAEFGRWLVDAATHARRIPRDNQAHFVYVDRQGIEAELNALSGY